MIIYKLVKFQSEGYGIQDEHTVDYYQCWNDANHVMDSLKFKDTNNTYTIYNIYVVEARSK